MKFFLGTHRPNWLGITSVPLFVSDRTLRTYRTLPRARGEWALDSGGFSELSRYGSWDRGPSPRQYADRVRRYRDEIGALAWAAPQDWMCEPFLTAKTGLSVAEHQRRTVENVIELRAVAPEVPFIPVLQGWSLSDYLACARRYAEAGVDLATEPIVGIGSVCRRQATTETAAIISALGQAVPGIRLHGFGIKTSGLGNYGGRLASADSMAWSMAARRQPALPGCTGHSSCANCPKFAFRWRERVLASLAGHATRTSASATASVPARRLETPQAMCLALAAFRDEAARLERDASIRWAHRDGMPVPAIAALTDLSPSRVRQILRTPDPPLLDVLRALRAHWGVDQDPASRAAADHLLAHFTAAALARDRGQRVTQDVSASPLPRRRSRSHRAPRCSTPHTTAPKDRTVQCSSSADGLTPGPPDEVIGEQRSFPSGGQRDSELTTGLLISGSPVTGPRRSGATAGAGRRAG